MDIQNTNTIPDESGEALICVDPVVVTDSSLSQANPDIIINATPLTVATETGMSIGAKVILWVLGIGGLGLGGFFALNSYENINDCIIQYNNGWV